MQASCGGTHTMVLTDRGHMFIWGRCLGGRLGFPAQSTVEFPHELALPGGAERWHPICIAAGGRHSMCMALPRHTVTDHERRQSALSGMFSIPHQPIGATSRSFYVLRLGASGVRQRVSIRIRHKLAHGAVSIAQWRVDLTGAVVVCSRQAAAAVVTAGALCAALALCGRCTQHLNERSRVHLPRAAHQAPVPAPHRLHRRHGAAHDHLGEHLLWPRQPRAAGAACHRHAPRLVGTARRAVRAGNSRGRGARMATSQVCASLSMHCSQFRSHQRSVVIRGGL